jgi:3-oxoadipate enol-lactonase
MPHFETDGLRVHYQVEGADGAPWLILSNSLGTQFDMWAPQMPALRKQFRVLRYDTRGHGQSGVPPGPYTIAQLGEDVTALMDHLQIARAHFCGLSMGGMIGIWLGANRPARIDRLVLANTAPRIGPPELWSTRIDKVNREGMAAIVPAVIDRWFTADYQQNARKEVDLLRQMLLQTHTVGYAACCAALRDMDLREALFAIRAPTLVIAGTHDQSTPPEHGRLAADRIAGARYVELDAAHLSNWETADPFTDNLIGFLKETT